MKKIAIVYWSGTGNTAQMAEAVAEGAGAAGAQANLFTPSDFSPAQVKDYDAIAFGCPAMGAYRQAGHRKEASVQVSIISAAPCIRAVISTPS